MQAIVTRYAGPTNHRGARVIVKAQAGRKVIPWDHAHGPEHNHRDAALAFARSMRWMEYGDWELVGGAMPDGTGYCFVLQRKR
jgi:hypothetical protein